MTLNLTEASWQTPQAHHCNEMLARLANFHANQGRRETATILHQVWRHNEERITQAKPRPQKRVFMKSVVRPPIKEVPNQKVNAAITRVASAFLTSPDAIMRDVKKPRTILARYVCYYVLHHRFGYSLARTGRMMNRHYSSVINGVERLEQRMALDEALRVKVRGLCG